MTEKCPRCGGPVEVKKDPEGRDVEICRDCSVPLAHCICRPLPKVA